MANAPRAFRGADVRSQVRITGFDLTPDGSTAVYARQTIERDRYRSRLWRIAVDGGRPERLTDPVASDGRPRISPDGSRVLFVSDREGEKPQVWVMPLGGGEASMLPGFPDGVAAAEWAPDGRRVAVIAPNGEQRFIEGAASDPTVRRITTPFWRLDGAGVVDQLSAVWIASASGRGKPRRITPANRSAASAIWAPDGKTIAVLAATPDGTIDGEVPQPFLVAPDGGRLRPLTPFPGGVMGAAWSPEGRLAVIANRLPFVAGWQNSALFVRDGAGWVRLPEDLDRPIGNFAYGDLFTGGLLGTQEPHWLDERNLLVSVSDHGTALPHRIGLDGWIERLVDGEMVSIEERTARGRVVLLATDRACPPELYEAADGGARRITTDGGRWFGPFRRDPERISKFATRPRSIDAWFLSGGRGRRPTVLQIHGGPHAMHSATPWLDMTAVASAGFHVVYANPSGSVGYGEDLARRLFGDWGDPDTRELLALLDRLAADGIVDADRLGAMGASYGGYLVNHLAGHHPDRFRALVSENPVTDHVAEWGGADFPFEIAVSAVGESRVPQHVEELVAASPYRSLQRARAAMLLLHTDGDLRCPPINTDIAFAVLHRAGATVEMIRYPNEPHGLKTNGRPDRRVDRIERIVGWFRQHL